MDSYNYMPISRFCRNSGNNYRVRRSGSDDDGGTSHSTTKSSCSCLLVLRLLDTALLLGLCIAQGSLLNFLIIYHRQQSHVVYLWFLADFVVVMAFVGALSTSYRRIYRQMRRALKSILPIGLDLPVYGVLPLGYLSWLLYSCVLTAKIVVVFRLGIAANLGKEGLFNSQLLKIVIGGGASLVFLLLVNAHQPPSNPNDDSRSYMAALCTGTAFEIFDAIAFLELLFVNESRVTLTFPLESGILALASINLILPTIPLLRLSLSDFGQKERPPLLGLVYSTVKLVAIEVPYLGIRAYLWNVYDASTSTVFMLKNILMIIVKIRYSIPEYAALLIRKQEKRRKVQAKMEMNTVM